MVTFLEWLNSNGIHLGKWEMKSHVEMNESEVEEILERYLRNVRRIYGDPVCGERHIHSVTVEEEKENNW